MLAVIRPPGSCWISQRDHLLWRLPYNTGARVCEVIGVRVGVVDVVLSEAACVHLHGKGRKQRTVPLWHSTVSEIRAWQRANPQLDARSPLLLNREGEAMTRNNVNKRLALSVNAAARTIPDLVTRHVSHHTIRHTTAMHLLQSGVDISVIALWLGHKGPTTTHHYVEVDLAMMDRALARIEEPGAQISWYKAPDSLLAFLKAL